MIPGSGPPEPVNPNPPARILIVEDEALVALDIEDQLLRLGYHVVGTVDDAQSALARAAETAPDLVLMDVQIRGEADGIDAALRLRHELGVAVVFLTAFADAGALERAKQAAPHGYILKPFDERDLRTTIEIALHRDRLEREARRHEERMRAVLDAQRAGILLLDGAGEVLFANQAALRMSGDDASEVVGRSWVDVLTPPAEVQRKVEAQLALPAERRTRVAATIAGASRDWQVELEIRDDPSDGSRRILQLHDVSELHDLRRLLAEQGTFHDIVGRSEPIRRVIEVVRQVATVDATVLVLGETGTGKELVARAIHRESGRRDGPFVAVNCAGISDELASSQLFGHRRGAFTGAVADTPGVFEAAHRGTLFLDEIGDLSPRLQTALLRALEERTVTRLGETRPRPVDVRIVAATNRDLARDATDGRFRADLLYRIRVGRVLLPPLRERREDLWLLVRHLLAEHRAVTGRPVEAVSDEAMQALLGYAWPGNVRELKNVLGYAVIHCPGSTVELEDLPPEVLDSARTVTPLPDLPVDERARIEAALARTGGERKAAAALLGISRATLYRKLAQLGIE